MHVPASHSGGPPAASHLPKPEELAAKLWQRFRIADDALFRAKDACEGYPRDPINAEYVRDQAQRAIGALIAVADLVHQIGERQEQDLAGEEPVFLNDRYRPTHAGTEYTGENGGEL